MWRRRPVPRGALTLAVGLLAAGIAIAVGATGVLDRLELSSVDERFTLRGTQSEPQDVVVVGLDDADLKRVHSPVLQALAACPRHRQPATRRRARGRLRHRILR